MPFATEWIAVLDANVLYPPLLRDVLVGLATANLYEALWSDEILAEVERNLLRHLSPEKTAKNITALPSPPDMNYLLVRLSVFAPSFTMELRKARKS